jgi:hypothetical protein
MKKIYTVLCISFWGLAVNAQTITRQNLPFPGDSLSSVFVNSEDDNWNPGGSGDGQTWDFSGFTGDPVTQKYTAVNSTVYTNAQFKLSLDNLGESYFSATESDYRIVGVATQFEGFHIEVPYINDQIMFKFPMMYQDNFKDTAYSEHTSTITYSGFPIQVLTKRTTYSETTVDGRGTLKLANKTYEDVLRVKVYAAIFDTAVGPFSYNETVTSSTEEYYYFSAQYNHQLAYFMNFESRTSKKINEPLKFIFTFSDPIVLSNNTALSEKNSMVYPNPANGFVNFSSESDATIEIFDMQGRSALRTSMNKGLKNINISDLKSGLYNYRITPQSGDVVTGKLTVQ